MDISYIVADINTSYMNMNWIYCILMELSAKRIDDEDDDMIVNDHDVQNRLVVVTQVYCLFLGF